MKTQRTGGANMENMQQAQPRPCTTVPQSKWEPSSSSGKHTFPRLFGRTTPTKQLSRKHTRCSSHSYGAPSQSRFARRYLWGSHCGRCRPGSPSHWKKYSRLRPSLTGTQYIRPRQLGNASPTRKARSHTRLMYEQPKITPCW